MPDATHPPLLPCPFCGGEAQHVDDQDVGCLNIYCLVQPQTTTPTGVSGAIPWNTRHVDPATLALARLGAAYFSPTLGEADITAVAALNTPSVRERIAELLGDTTTADVMER